MEDTNKMREEIKRRIHEVENELQALKELVDSEAFAPKENELTPLAQALSSYLKNDFEFFATKKWDEKKWNEVMNTQAGELLAIAKKELLEQWGEDMKNEYARGKRDGLTLGYNKAMKEYNESVAYHYDNPPYVLCRFGGVCNNPMKDCLNCPMNPVGLNTTTTTSGTCKKED